MIKYEMLQFRVRQETKEAIQKYCKENGITLSVFFRLIIQKILAQNKQPLEEIKDLDFDKEGLEFDKKTFLQKDKEMDFLYKDIREMKALINSIVQYIKTKELKELHTDLHPRENPKEGEIE